MSRIKILVCCHKPSAIPDDPMYLPVQVGKEIAKQDLGIQGDNEPDSDDVRRISRLNPVYCEMTAMYWAWKNIRKLYPDVRYVGLCHYRRYFNANDGKGKDLVIPALKKVRESIRILAGRVRKITIYEPLENIKSIHDRRFRNSNRKLKEIILANEMVYTKPVNVLTGNVGMLFGIIGRTYLELLEEIIASEYSDYRNLYKTVISNNEIISSNMLVLKTDYLDDYCGFVFGVLNRHLELVRERGICNDPEKEGAYARVSGYLAEILTHLYISKKKNEIKSEAVRKFFVTT